MLEESTFNHILPKHLLNSCFIENEWVILYKYQNHKDCGIDGLDIWSEYNTYIAEPSLSESILSNYSCDYDGTGRCALWGEKYNYSRFFKVGIEPLVSVLNFNSVTRCRKQIRIHEDFIFLFHLLEEVDAEGNRSFIHFHDGDSKTVITIINNEVRILHQFLNDYLAARRMNFVCHVHSEVNIRDPYLSNISFRYKLTGPKGVTEKTESSISNYSVYMNSGIELQSWFWGKKVVPYKEYGRFKSTFDFDYADFIIGYDVNSCSDITANCGDPQFKYSRTFFKKSVVEKYIDDQNASIDQHSISTSYFYLKCDNDNVNYVWAYLKDLTALPYAEQVRWKSFNFYNTDETPSLSYQEMSKGCWSFLASSPEFNFKYLLNKLNKLWDSIFGWELFCPPESRQANIANQLTVLGSDNQGACLKLIQKLNVILTESINVEGLKRTEVSFGKGTKSIVKLSLFLESKGISHSPFVNYLLQLDTLRSELTDAHKHSSDISANFQKALTFFEFNIDSTEYRKLSIALFDNANQAIQDLMTNINNL